MSRIAVFLTGLLVLGLGAAPAKSTDAELLRQWLQGKHKDEVIRAFGPPTRTRRHHGKTRMIYKFTREGAAYFPSDTPNPHAFIAEQEPGGSGTIDTILDIVFHSDDREYEKGNFALTEEAGPIRRIELLLDAQDRVKTARVVLRKRKAQSPEPDGGEQD